MFKLKHKKITMKSAYFFALTLFLSGLTTDAMAAGTPANGGVGLGTVIGNTVNSFADVPGVLTGIAYLFGVILGFLGIMKLKAHVENPNQTEIWDPLKRFIAGGSFFALPTVFSAVITTVSKDVDDIKGSDYNTTGATGAGLDAKMVALIKDVWEPLHYLFVGFGYIAGFILILIGISRLLKTEQEGARGPMGLGTIMTFLVAGVLLSLNKILGAAVNSIFASDVKAKGVLNYTAGMDATAVGHANAVIGAIMAFVALIGWISFIRGFFIMRGVAEGNSQASMMAGVTHIIGGAIAVNLGAFINAVQATLGITGYGMTFSDATPYLTNVTFFA